MERRGQLSKDIDKNRSFRRPCNEMDSKIQMLHRYIDTLSSNMFFGSVEISWEKGQPVFVKEHKTLKIADIARELKL